MRVTSRSAAETLHRDSLVIDMHVHGPSFVPQPFRVLHRGLNPRRPREIGFGALRDASVDSAVVKAVGDPIVTRWYVGRSPWDAVEAQLSLMERQVEDAGARVVVTDDEIEAGRRDGHLTVLLGVEGADALDGDLDRVDAWADRGVRVVVPVHLGHNAIGTTCLPWQRYVGPFPVRRRSSLGLTPFGRRVIDRMCAAGIVIDAAHADRATLLGMVDAAAGPVISSHAGARRVEDFPRFLDDDEIKAIASTGGVMGLWPYRAYRHGPKSLLDLAAHARHVADVVGPEHLCIGTDMNGVPGLVPGYRGPHDLPKVTSALLDAGFTPDEVRAVLGTNALRVLRQAGVGATRRSRTDPSR